MSTLFNASNVFSELYCNAMMNDDNLISSFIILKNWWIHHTRMYVPAVSSFSHVKDPVSMNGNNNDSKSVRDKPVSVRMKTY